MTDALINPAIEHAVLAAVLRDNAVLDAIARLQSQHFGDAEVRAHYETALDLRREGRPINLVTLGALAASDPLGGASIAERLAAVSFDGVPPTPLDMAHALIDLAHRREIKALGDHLAEAAGSMATKPASLAAMAMRECDRLLAADQPAGRTYWSNDEGIEETLRSLDDQDAAAILPTGLTDLDRMIGGLRRRTLTYFAGRPGSGKSTVAGTIVTNVASAGHGVVFFSFEMPRRDLDARRISAATYGTSIRVPYSKVINQQMTHAEREHFARVGMTLKRFPIFTEERVPLSMPQIVARVRKARQELADDGKRLGLVVIDHIGKITPRDHRAPAVEQLGQISNDIAALARSEDVAMLALSQVNRQVEQREDKRPYMSDLRASGRLEEDADNVLMLFRPAYYLRDPPDNEAARDVEKEAKRIREYRAKEHLLEINVEKARNAVTGTVKLFCDIGFNVVQDLDRRAQ